LSPEAKERLNRFEKFVLDESQKREAEAKKACDTAISAINNARISMKDIRSITALLRDTLGNAKVAKSFKDCAVSNAWRLRSILRAVTQTEVSIHPRLMTVPNVEMEAISQELAARANTLLAEKNSPERQALVAEHNGLKDRQWLGTIKTDVLDHIKRMQSIAAIKEMQNSTATNKITSLSNRLASHLVTDRLRACFSREVAQLGIAEQHAVELQHATTRVGVPLFQVRMISSHNASVGKVLSEGEHRCVALAAFLAELSTLETASGIVFDDPVSSLDHIHRDRVAKRLATESLSRQVIIFTHDIAFLMLLEDACRETRNRQAIPIAYRVVSRGQDSAGFCNTEPPANVFRVNKVVEKMRSHLGHVKIHHERGDQASWRREVRSFSVQLREAWERAVEETVSPVIKRLAKKVDTGGLIQLTVLQEQDCNDMRDAYGRCSELLHSQPGELNPRLPTPAKIEEEIACLEAWLVSIRNRQGQVV
jgi:energy-coupling factor transporter ATP-binding protein EcfA2